MDQAQEVEAVKASVAKHFPVYDVKVAYETITFFISVDTKTLEAKFDGLRKELGDKGYIPILEFKGGEHTLAVVRKPTMNRRAIWINIALLCITSITTIVAGTILWAGYNNSPADQVYTLDNILWGTAFFAIPLMTILGVHELSHFLMSKRHGVDASLPYFIPSFPPLGTFGAFISMRDPMPSRRALIDIGAAGPIGGLIVTIPVAIIGLWLNSQGVPHPGVAPGGTMEVSIPLFYQLMQVLIPTPADVYLHPMAFAAWVGFFVTAINLLPAGQLDGGHIARGLLGENAKYVSYGAIVFLLILGVLFYFGWLIFAALILFLGTRHPSPLNDVSKLDAKRIGVGALVVLILIGSFVLVPISIVPSEESFTVQVVDSNNTTMAAGQTVQFHCLINNTGTVGYNLTMNVNQVPAGWSAVLYLSNSTSANATSTLMLRMTYQSTADIVLEVKAPATAIPGKRIIPMQASSIDTIVIAKFSINIV